MLRCMKLTHQACSIKPCHHTLQHRKSYPPPCALSHPTPGAPRHGKARAGAGQDKQSKPRTPPGASQDPDHTSTKRPHTPTSGQTPLQAAVHGMGAKVSELQVR